MYRFLFLSVLLLWAASLYSQNSEEYRDVVYLKNGSIIKGIILTDVPDVEIEIRSGGNIFYYTYDQVLKKEKEKVEVKIRRERELTQDDLLEIEKLEAGKKNPEISFYLSLLLPGSGQFYNGDYLYGGIQMGFALTGWALIGTGIYRIVNNVVYPGTGTYYNDRKYDVFYSAIMISSGSVLIAAFGLWSIIDAPRSAIRFNDATDEKINKLRYARTDAVEKPKFDFAFYPNFNGSKFTGLTLNLDYRF